MELSTEIYHKLTKAWMDIMKEYGVKAIEVNVDFHNWTGEYFEDPLSRMSRIIAEKSNKE